MIFFLNVQIQHVRADSFEIGSAICYKMGLGNQYGIGTVAETRDGHLLVRNGPNIDDVITVDLDSVLPVAMYSDITVVINGGKRFKYTIMYMYK